VEFGKKTRERVTPRHGKKIQDSLDWMICYIEGPHSLRRPIRRNREKRQ